MKKQLHTPHRFGIIGCGNIVQRHALAASTFGELLAICDINKERSDQLAAQYKCRAYYSLEDLLQNERLDVVSICTPNYLHAKHSIECLQNGTHVICEKPMAINSADAKEMTAVAQAFNKELFIVKQLRYYPHILLIKKLIQAGQLGKIYSFHLNCFWNRPNSYYRDWRGNKKMDGGTLYTQFSHYIDLILWLFGEVEATNFFGANLGHPAIEFEDTGIIGFKMKSAAVGNLNYTVNAKFENIENSITIFAEEGSLKLCGAMLQHFDYFNVKDVQQPDSMLADAPTEKSKSHFKVYENVVNALNGSDHSILKAAESINSIMLIEKIYQVEPKSVPC